MTVWLTSDPHFGHALAARDRGFETVEEHDAQLVRNFRKVVRDGDDVWWLGDIAFAGWRERTFEALNRIGRGTHHLVLGNHDRAHPLNSRAHEYERYYRLAGFDTVTTMSRISYNGRGARLSHFPYSGDHEDRDDRFAEWRLRDEGHMLLHGHTHSREKLSFSAASTPQVHVGVDAWGMKPVSVFDAFEVCA